MEWLSQLLAHYWTALQSFLAIDPVKLTQPEMIGRLCLQVMLLFGSAFFSGSETALFSLSRLDLQRLRKERNRHSETLHELLDQPRRLIISILCGNELINIAAAANMTGILVVLYGADRAGLINVLVMVPLLLLFGEVTPKTIAVSNPLRVSTGVVASPMSVWVRMITPLRWIIRSIADRVTTWIVGEEKAKDNILQVDEFRSLVEEVAKEGELTATERALIYNLLEASDTEIVEIMTPRTRTHFINGKLTVPEMVEQFKLHKHSRVPVYRVHRDNVVGFIHAEDILRLVFKDVDFSAMKKKDIMRSPIMVPLTKRVDEMFEFFQHNQARAAVVLNEFGGVEGFITMQNVLDFIFGEISEDVEGQEFYQERDENFYEVPGEMKLTDFNNLTNFGIEDPRMTTIAGVAFRHLDRLPRVNDKVTVDEFVMTIVEMDGHRISTVRVVRGAALEEELEEAAQTQTKAEKIAEEGLEARQIAAHEGEEAQGSGEQLEVIEESAEGGEEQTFVGAGEDVEEVAHFATDMFAETREVESVAEEKNKGGEEVVSLEKGTTQVEVLAGTVETDSETDLVRGADGVEGIVADQEIAEMEEIPAEREQRRVVGNAVETTGEDTNCGGAAQRSEDTGGDMIEYQRAATEIPEGAETESKAQRGGE